jgi:N-acetylmuramoyl-L-alanine amidase
MFKITHDQYMAMLSDPETPNEMIIAFSTFAPDEGGAFDPVMIPDPRWVEMTQAQLEAESAMRIGNGLARFRRQNAFRRAISAGDRRPVLVAEGDSWFQFPVFIDETVDQLGSNYLVSCVSAAGDTARNMIFGSYGPRRREYMRELDRNADRVQAFLLSAAGNDIIGEDDEAGDGTPVLRKILTNPGNGSTDAADYIRKDELDTRIDFLHHAYRSVCASVRHDPRFEKLPILLHGYDVPFPHPWTGSDRRNPRWAAKDRWLGSAFSFAGIEGPIRREILEMLIGRLYDMLQAVAQEYPHVHVVDCRGALPDVTDWADEIHATSQGYAKVALRFRDTLRGLGVG